MCCGRSRADSLAGVPMFAGMAAESDRGQTPLSASPWAGLAAAAEPERVRAGEWLFRQGDPGDSLYVVLTGRLEIVVERPLADGGARARPRRRRRRAGAADGLAAVGSVRARRDSELLKVSREAFEKLLDERPEFARSLTRVLGAAAARREPRRASTRTRSPARSR